MTVPAVAIADHSAARDPTRTLHLRTAFRAAAQLRLGQLRSLLRVAIIDHDMLGLSLSKTFASFIGPAARLQQFSGWFEAESRTILAGPWYIEWVNKAIESGGNKAVREVGKSAVMPTDVLQHLQELAYRELVGIAAALTQNLSRDVATILERKISPVLAYGKLAKRFNKVAVNRLHAFANVMTVSGHVKAKLEVYRAVGITQVGVIPEVPSVHRPHPYPLPSLLDSIDGMPLYAFLPLENVDEWRAWAKSQGFKSIIVDPHVTVLYSKAPLDWSLIEYQMAGIIVPPGGERSIERMGQGAVVLRFDSPGLQDRHNELVALGGSHDFDTYRPHLTISYDAGDLDLEKIEPYQGPLDFGLETFRQIDLDPDKQFTPPAEILLDAFDPDEARDPKGEWTSGGEGDKPQGFSEQGGGILAFHGTTEEVAQSIITNGIEVNPADRSFNFIAPGVLYKDERGRSVYVASTMTNAIDWAQRRSGQKSLHSPDLVVFELNIPKTEWTKFKADEEVPLNAARAPLNIPPAWIVKATGFDAFDVDGENPHPISLHRDSMDSDTVTRYMAILVSQHTHDAGFDPDEPREHGEWTSGGGSSAGTPVPGYSAAARLDKKGVIHTSNVYDATKALAANKKVDLNQPREVSTLITHLGEVAKHMIDMGKVAPVFNLCNVSVEGTNLFCAQTKGIPRVKMPQLKGDQAKAFRKYLEAKGYKTEKTRELTSHLRATQDEIDGGKVARVAQRIIKADEGWDDMGKRLIISKDNYILDGHHHWAAQLGLDAKNNKLGDVTTKVTRVNIGIIQLLKEAEKFTGGKGKEGIADSFRDDDLVGIRTAGDDAVCEECEDYADDAPYDIDEIELPLHPNCLPGDSLVTSVGRIAAVSERFYKGNLTVIHTASGRELACTPNHPILTDQGWVAARLLNVGGKIVCHSGGEWSGLVNVDNKNVPTRIEDVAAAFAKSGLAHTVPTSAPDFHGDGGDGEVAIIRTNSFLWDQYQPSLFKHSCQSSLMWRVMSDKLLAGLRSLQLSTKSILLASSGCVGGFGLALSGGPIHSTPFNQLLLGSTAQDNVTQETIDDCTRPTVGIGQRLNRVTGQIFSDDFFLDSITVISSRVHRGLVYTLETEAGYYIAQGIGSKNCRCSVYPWDDQRFAHDAFDPNQSRGQPGNAGEFGPGGGGTTTPTHRAPTAAALRVRAWRAANRKAINKATRLGVHVAHARAKIAAAGKVRSDNPNISAEGLRRLAQLRAETHRQREAAAAATVLPAGFSLHPGSGSATAPLWEVHGPSAVGSSRYAHGSTREEAVAHFRSLHPEAYDPNARASERAREAIAAEHPVPAGYRIERSRPVAGRAPRPRSSWTPEQTEPTPASTAKYKKADFDKAKVKLGGSLAYDTNNLNKFLSDYESRIGEDPEAFKKTFTGGLDVPELEVSLSGNTWYLRGDVHVNGLEAGDFRRYINWENKKATSSYFAIHKQYQKLGLGKKLLAGNVVVYQKLGLKELDVHANIDVGGHAWARYGYIPSQSSWDNLRSSIGKQIISKDPTQITPSRSEMLRNANWSEEKIENLEAVLVNIPLSDQKILERAVNDDDPKGMWTVADSKYGKALLMGSDWNGTLHLDDPDSMTRFNAYIGSKPKPVTANA